jgi:uncharacterized protein (TIGR03435 family)
MHVKIPNLATIALLAACQAFAQTGKPSESFEVASVKEVPGHDLPAGFSTAPRRSGGRISWVTNPALLLRYAFGLPDWRIVRADKSDKNSDEPFYAIDATMDASATDDQVRAMLRKLLEDRFGLVTHRETNTVQGYALVVAKNGPKIKPAVPGETPPMPAYLAGKSPEAFEGRIMTSKEGKGTSALMGRGVSIAQLVNELSANLNTLVLDQTGMTGSYYFGFKFLTVRDVPAADVEGSTIFDALQSELGLRLEKQKGQVEVVVVDHLGKPSGN